MSAKNLSVWIGFDPREATAFAVARKSILQFHRHLSISGLVLNHLRSKGYYYRPTDRSLGRLWDVTSDAPMSTEFAISRFLVPAIIKKEMLYEPNDWALFMDCDVMLRAPLVELRDLLTSDKAVYCVKHNHVPTSKHKMDGQIQTDYPRKNWSSVMAFNLSHPANRALTVDAVNSHRGRELHAFCWLKDDEIGELPPEWNYLVGHTQLPEGVQPKIVHWTDGGPWFEAFREAEYADEWRSMLEHWAA